MAGTFNLFDGQQLTASSEYDSRYGTPINTLQPHHATMTSLSGLISLMMPGGREVSANGAMGNDGTLIEVVPANMRAYTSASSFDRQCITVEACNTTLGPEWGLSDATHRRFGRLAADMRRLGMLTGFHEGVGGIVPHNKVPGSYPTACPGPCYNYALIRKYAEEYFTGTAKKKESDMIHIDRLVNAQGNAYLGTTRITNDATAKFIDLNEGTQKTEIGQLRYFLDQDSISTAGHGIVTGILSKLAVGAVDVDEAALARELAPLIDALSDEDLQKIGKYTVDEEYKRLAS